MALVNKAFSVNVTPGMMPPIVHVSEYDVGRAYTVSIIDEQGNTFTIPSGTTASIEGTLNGSVGFTQSATVSNNQVSFTLSESMTAYSGKAWCKIKLTQNSQPIQTCAFVLAVDRAGVEAETVIGAPSFQEQINQGVAEYFDNDPPFFELPSGGQRGQALLSDGNDSAYWGDVQSGGSGLSDEAKAALLACFRNVAWIGADGQDYYDDLYDALYPPAPPASLTRITALFNQGSHAVYDTDTLDSLKPYLTVTAYYSNGTSQPVTAYTLSGTLAVGTSVITVSYGGKTATFNVTVIEAGPSYKLLTDDDIISSVGISGLSVNNGSIAITSSQVFSIIEFAESANKSIFTPSRSATVVSQVKPSYFQLIYKKVDDSTFYGTDGTDLFEFKLSSGKYSATKKTGLGTLTATGTVNNDEQKTILLENGVITISCASGSLAVDNANVFGIWQSSTNTLLPQNMEVWKR